MRAVLRDIHGERGRHFSKPKQNRLDTAAFVPGYRDAVSPSDREENLPFRQNKVA
jgi:hypothetical protein